MQVLQFRYASYFNNGIARWGTFFKGARKMKKRKYLKEAA
jgi:hypothetical protein